MKILLTGGSGMVGKNVLDVAKSLSLNILSPTRQDLDLLNFSEVKAYIKVHKPDCIIHAAGLVGGIQANLDEPIAYLIKNTDIGRNVILAAKELNVLKFLNIGSSCIYPKFAKNPLKESYLLDGPFEPTNEPYALAKLFSLKLCEYISQSDENFYYKTIIPCNLYGKYDNFDLRKSHMIPAAINKINAAKRCGDSHVTIWGDGTVKREFMYAEDLANFIFFALSNFDKMPQNINIGTGKDYTIKEYYSVIAKALLYKGKFDFDLSKPIGMKQKLVDISRLNTFGWKAKSSLKDGIMKTVDYFKNTKI